MFYALYAVRIDISLRCFANTFDTGVHAVQLIIIRMIRIESGIVCGGPRILDVEAIYNLTRPVNVIEAALSTTMFNHFVIRIML
jgi:hypothetical protein